MRSDEPDEVPGDDDREQRHRRRASSGEPDSASTDPEIEAEQKAGHGKYEPDPPGKPDELPALAAADEREEREQERRAEGHPSRFATYLVVRFQLRPRRRHGRVLYQTERSGRGDLLGSSECSPIVS